ncbi:MAG: hypothetical protein ISS70_05850 [Phycisphaerae bacterium]|nr:hypothetical protein [Phycisphaerae bacterium]
MIEIPGMLMVGARYESDGKTALTRTLIERFGTDLYEPLFAAYKKSALPAMEELLQSGNNKMIDSYSRCRVRYVDLPGRQFRNINTKAEYGGLVEERGDAGI